MVRYSCKLWPNSVTLRKNSGRHLSSAAEMTAPVRLLVPPKNRNISCSEEAVQPNDSGRSTRFCSPYRIPASPAITEPKI